MENKFYYSKAVILKPIFSTLIIVAVLFRKAILRWDFREYDMKYMLFIGGVLLVFTLINMFIKFTLYKSSYIEINEESIIYRKKTLFSEKQKESPLHTISNIHIKKSILDKIFSSVSVHLDINSSETANKDDYSILLSDESAKNFKKMFDHYKNKETVVEEKKETPYDVVYKYSKKECILHILFNVSIFLLLFAIASAILSISDVIDKFSIVSFLIFIVMFFYDSVKKIEKYYNYSIYSNDTHIHWTYGYFNKEEFEIEKSKIISTEIKQTFIARIFKRYSVDINIVGVGSEKSDMKTIVLYTSKDKMSDILEKILPDNNLITEYKKEERIVLIYKVIKTSVFLSAFLFIPILRSYILYYLIFIVAIDTFVLLHSKNLAFRYVNGRIMIRDGLFEIKTNEIDIKTLEYIDVEMDVIYKKIGVKRLVIHYKDSKGVGKLESPYLKKIEFETLLEDFNY